jgi:hypothetical protein
MEVDFSRIFRNEIIVTGHLATLRAPVRYLPLD